MPAVPRGMRFGTPSSKAPPRRKQQQTGGSCVVYHDLARLVEGVRRARTVLRTEPLTERVSGPELPPWRELDYDDQAALERAIRAGVCTYHHPVGTCRMGPDPESGAVVDAACRTHRIERLVVADASVMPEIPAASTNVPTIMVAEQVSARLTSETHIHNRA